MISREIEQIVEVYLPFTPREFLLNELSKTSNKYLVSYLLVDTQLLLAKNWKLSDLPAKENWYQKVWRMCFMDKLMAIGL